MAAGWCKAEITTGVSIVSIFRDDCRPSRPVNVISARLSAYGLMFWTLLGMWEVTSAPLMGVISRLESIEKILSVILAECTICQL